MQAIEDLQPPGTVCEGAKLSTQNYGCRDITIHLVVSPTLRASKPGHLSLKCCCKGVRPGQDSGDVTVCSMSRKATLERVSDAISYCRSARPSAETHTCF